MSEHFGYGDEDVHALSGAYAVDALDEHEGVRFEQHLRVCPECRAEVDSLREAAATLGIEEDEAPPAALREHVLSGIQSVRPLPPLSAAVDDTTDALSVHRARRRFRVGPQLLVAAAVVLIAAVGLFWASPWNAGDQTPPPTATEQVLTADDATRASQEFPDGSRATIVVSREVGRAVILTEDMAPAPIGKVYQLWLQSPQDDMAPAGLMPDESDATVLLEGDASHAVGVGITVEPDGGSQEPTSEPIAVIALDA